MRAMRREALHIEGPTIGYMAGMELAKKVSIVAPFLTWPLVAIMAFILHQFWPDNMWVMGFISVAAIMFSWFAWYLTRDRKGLASEHAVISILLYGAIFAMVDHMGWTRVTTFLMIFGVFLICCSWSMRNIIRHHDKEAGAGIDSIFTTAGLEGTKMYVKPDATERISRAGQSRGWWNSLTRKKPAEPEVTVTDIPKAGKQRPDGSKKRREVRFRLKPGETADTLTKRIPAIESAAGVPPGTLQVNIDPDNAQWANGFISDPRAIKDPVPYPGPSYIGGSIADTISTGMYQDGTEMEWDILGVQLQIMGMVGSGKSLGAGWSALAEIITRHDAMVWGIDVTKGEQTLGPLAPAIHRLATDEVDAMRLLEDTNTLIKPRTDYLSAKGLGKWQKGCGLKYLVVWLEEVPDIIEAIGDEGEALWIKSVKAARSAGISFVWSLQRADYSQIPTITRGQAAKWCFGVADTHEASFGLSTAQDNAGCSPESWGNRFPGKCYLDAPSIPTDKVPMPGRAWYWGTDDKKIRAHAEQYPASDREPDEVMVRVLGPKPAPKLIEPPKTRTRPISVPNREDAGEVENEVLNDEVTDADLDTESEPESLANDFELKTDKVDPMPPAAARQVMRNWLVARAGQTVRNADLVEVRKSTGYGRSWGYKVMGEFEDERLVRRVDDSDGISWVVTNDQTILSRDEL